MALGRQRFAMKLEREQTLLGFKESYVPTYYYTALPGSLPKVQDPSLGLGFLHKKHMYLELQP